VRAGETYCHLSYPEADVKTLKQAAPGNYPARCSARRFLHLFSAQPVEITERWVIRGSRLLSTFLSLPHEIANLPRE